MSGLTLTPPPSYTHIITDPLASKQQNPPPPLPDLAFRRSRVREGMPDNRPGPCVVAKLPPRTALKTLPTFCIYMGQLIIQNPAFRRRWPPDTQTSAGESVIAASDVRQQIC